MELNEIRPFFSLAFKRLLQLDPQEAERQEAMEDEPDEDEEEDEAEQAADRVNESERNGYETGVNGLDVHEP